MDKRRTNTKNKLLQTAVKLFAEKGVKECSIRDLCTANNIKESSFYRHFKSKSILIEAVYTYFTNQIALNEIPVELFMSSITEGNFINFWVESIKLYFSRTIDENDIISQFWLFVSIQQFFDPLAVKVIQTETNRVVSWHQRVFDKCIERKLISNDFSSKELAIEFSYAIHAFNIEFIALAKAGLDKVYILERAIIYTKNFFSRVRCVK